MVRAILPPLNLIDVVLYLTLSFQNSLLLILLVYACMHINNGAIIYTIFEVTCTVHDCVFITLFMSLFVMRMVHGQFPRNKTCTHV